MEQIKNLNNIQQLQIFTHTNTEIFIPYPSFHTDNDPLSSGNNNLNKSTSNSPAANSVHLYAHLHSPPVTIISILYYERPTLTQEHLEALWPIDTRKLWREQLLSANVFMVLLEFPNSVSGARGSYNWNQWWVKQLQSIFRQSSPLIQYLKEQKMCHIKHQHYQQDQYWLGWSPATNIYMKLMAMVLEGSIG